MISSDHVIYLWYGDIYRMGSESLQIKRWFKTVLI